MHFTLNFHALLAPPFFDQLVRGAQFTLALFVACWSLAVGVGILLAVLRISGLPFAERVVAIYVAYQRNVPMLAHLFLWYFGISTLLPATLQSWIGNHGGEFIFATIAIGLYMAAYFSEDIRSGLRSVPSGQTEAARSLGMGFLTAMRHVVLPQAINIAIPTFTNHTIVLFKNTSLAMALGAAEMTYAVREVENETFLTFEAYIVATVFYLAISLVLMAVGAAAARRVRLPAH